MPAGQDRPSTSKSRNGKQRVPSAKISKKEEKNNKNTKVEETNGTSFRRAPRTGEENGERNFREERIKYEEKLKHELSECLRDYSRQRMRAVHMSLRQYGNDDSRVSNRELQQALQENGVKLPNRMLQTLAEKYDVHGGVEFETVYQFMMEAHSKSGRDSVLAMHKRNDLVARAEVSQEEIDEDLVVRIQSLLIKDQAYIDVDGLRATFQSKDHSKSGKIDSFWAFQICSDQHMPVFGALLKNLIKRCDEEKTDKISWPQFLSFLERAQQKAWNVVPELKEMANQKKDQTPIEPTPMDELSTKARNVIVSKLRKKASLKKPEPTEPNHTDGIVNREPASLDIVENEVKQEVDLQTTMAADSNDGHTDSKRPQKIQKYAKVIKTSSGFLKTVKSIISGKKKEETEIETPASPGELGSSNSSGKTVQKISQATETVVAIADETTSQEPSKKDGEVEQISGENKKGESPNQKPNDSQSTVEKPEIILKRTKTKNEFITLPLKGKEIKFIVPEGQTISSTIDPPKERLKLHWVHGYRGNDCRKNIHVLSTGEIVYFISYIAVIYQRDLHRQRHYKEHTDDIRSIDIHSNGHIVATGQFSSRDDPSKKAHIRVWRIDTLQTVHVLGLNLFEKSVTCLAFQPGKDILAATDNSNAKRLTLWNTSTGDLQGEAILNSDLVCDIGFNKRDIETLVTIGKEHLAWWKVYPESKTVQMSAKPDYDGFLRAKFVICLSHNERGDLLTGDSNGTIYVWGEGGNKITNYIKHAHDGPIFTVMCDRSYILSSGRDGNIRSWVLNKNMDDAGQFQVSREHGGIRMLQNHESSLLIGTTMNSILHLKISKNGPPLIEAELDPIPITQSHYDDLRGLATLQSSSMPFDVITAGVDGILCCFNAAETKSVLRTQTKGAQYLCVDASADGKLLTLGTKDGHLVVLEFMDNYTEDKLDQKICKDRITCVKFSNDTRMIAAGSGDASIYVFSLKTKIDNTEAWELNGKLKGHTSPVTGLDWTKEKVDGEYLIRSSSVGVEQLVWGGESLVPLKDTSTLPLSLWASHNCVVDVCLIGVLSSSQTQDGGLQTVDVNASASLVAMGNSTGNMSLFRFPSFKTGAFCHTFRGHTSVHCVRFTKCGRFLLSVGGRDSCMLQWEVV